jgi:hypothetical protein
VQVKTTNEETAVVGQAHVAEDLAGRKVDMDALEKKDALRAKQ